MIFSLTQKDTVRVYQGGTKTFTVTPPTQATTVNGLVVIGFRFLVSSSITNITATDNQGNSYALVAIKAQPNDADHKSAMIYGYQTTGGVTEIYVVVTSVATPLSSSSFFSEYSGYSSRLNNTAIYDKESDNSSNGVETSFSVPAFSPSRVGNLIVVFLSFSNGGTNLTAGANYTRFGTSSFSQALDGEYRLASSTSETAPMTSGTTGASGWSEIAASFKTMPTGPFPTYLQ